MPFPPNPPPVDEAGAIIQPRQLNRWLDVNQVNKLTRTETYITIPAFSIDCDWKGYSELIATWNFEADHNFTLKQAQNVLPSSPNYVLCVMWEDQDRNVYRYALWQNVGEVFYFNVPLYTGQQIKANFRFEVWNVEDVTTAEQTTDVTLYTSVRGNYDYIWETDSALVISDGLVTNFAQTLTIPDPPSGTLTSIIQSRFRATDNFAAGTWTAMNGDWVISSADAVATLVQDGPVAVTCVKTTGAALTYVSGTALTARYTFVVAYCDGSSGTLINYNNKPKINVTSANALFNSLDIVPLNGTPKLYLFTIIDGYAVYVSDISERTTDSTPYTAAGVGVSTTLSVLSAGCTCGIAEILVYDVLSDFAGVYAYIYAKYGGFTLPLTFPADSVPQLNTI